MPEKLKLTGSQTKVKTSTKVKVTLNMFNKEAVDEARSKVKGRGGVKRPLSMLKSSQREIKSGTAAATPNMSLNGSATTAARGHKKSLPMKEGKES